MDSVKLIAEGRNQTMDFDREFRSFLQFSARIGADPLLTQGPGGNTSIKFGDTLRVKASGAWLADAATSDVFCDVPLTAIRRSIAQSEPGEAIERCMKELNFGLMRPSIETSLHALMPHPVVVHVHAVDVLAWVVRSGGERVVAPLMEGVKWAWAPYRRPGAPLMGAVKDSLSRDPDVVLLANHGVLVGGANVADAERRLVETVSRLRRNPRQSGAVALDEETVATAAAQGYRQAAAMQSHWLGTDPVSFELSRRGVYYPDQTVFLGPEMPVIESLSTFAQELDRWRRKFRGEPHCLVVKERGALVREGSSAAVDQQLLCHALFLARLDPGDSLETLSGGDIARLLNWDAEAYRQTMAPGARG